MKIIILGASQVGRSICDVLVSEDNDVTVVDLDGAALTKLLDQFDIRTVQGNAAYPAILSDAGAEDADIIIAVTNSDEINMLACQIAAIKFGTPTKIARIRSNQYRDSKDLFHDKGLTIDVVISPEAILTNHISRLVDHPGAFQVLDFAGGTVQLVGVKAYHDGPLVGSPLRDLKKHMPNIETRVAAIYRRNQIIKPKGHTIIKPDDEVFFVAARKHIRRVMGEMCRMDIKVKRILLAGGGNIGLSLARTLESNGYSVKIIEQNKSRAEVIAGELNNVVVLNGDAADADLLLQENIESIDAFIAVTESDEVNILAAMVAKRMGAKRVMALVNRSVYLEKLEHNDIDIVIAPREITVGTILAHIRQGDVEAVHSLRRGRAEAIEAVAHGDETSSKVVGQYIRDLPLPEGTGIGAIVRNKQVVIPDRDEKIETEDHVILFMVDKSCIHKVESLFEVDVSFI
ncbi:MAG: Trk system potassium transporter TrkA [Proteobacteria bacterium]|jgi:trk system potassium uptake protein|nr:Trk system potassium transporter TrkA [Pseudomonadota bacterium]